LYELYYCMSTKLSKKRAQICVILDRETETKTTIINQFFFQMITMNERPKVVNPLAEMRLNEIYLGDGNNDSKIVEGRAAKCLALAFLYNNTGDVSDDELITQTAFLIGKIYTNTNPPGLVTGVDQEPGWFRNAIDRIERRLGTIEKNVELVTNNATINVTPNEHFPMPSVQLGTNVHSNNLFPVQHVNHIAKPETDCIVIRLRNHMGYEYQPYPLSQQAVWNMSDIEKKSFLEFYGYMNIPRFGRAGQITMLLGLTYI
jgi:hypothetical protein